MEFVQSFWEMVKRSENILVTSHISPDDDSMSSVLAIKRLIGDKFPEKTVEIIYGDKPDLRYKSFAEYESVRFVDDVSEHLLGKDLIIGVDACQWSRFSGKAEELANFNGGKICIDHHRSPPDGFDLGLIDGDAASCADVIYRNFVQGNEIDNDLARIFLLGMLGDSGNFVFLRPEQMEVMEICRKLLTQYGKSVQDFEAEYGTISKQVFELLRMLITNTQYHEPAGGYPAWQWSGLSRSEVEPGGYSEAEISFAQHMYMDSYLRFIEGYRWGVVLTPKRFGRYNLSLRSLTGSVNVRELMEKMGIGGGHDRAAGGTMEPVDGRGVDLAEAQKRFEDWIFNNSQE